eukprot:2949418-Amphidinium_carterae.1
MTDEIDERSQLYIGTHTQSSGYRNREQLWTKSLWVVFFVTPRIPRMVWSMIVGCCPQDYRNAGYRSDQASLAEEKNYMISRVIETCVQALALQWR